MRFVQDVSRSRSLPLRSRLIHLDVRTAIFAHTVENMESTAALEARHPFRGTGTPEDLVGSAIFLASDDAAWVTGINLSVDGGYTAQ